MLTDELFEMGKNGDKIRSSADSFRSKDTFSSFIEHLLIGYYF
jgi:hypothetical protein